MLTYFELRCKFSAMRIAIAKAILPKYCVAIDLLDDDLLDRIEYLLELERAKDINNDIESLIVDMLDDVVDVYLEAHRKNERER